MLSIVLIKSVIAGIIASLACGLGVAPLLIKRFDPEKQQGLGFGFAGGLMFAASVYNLILPGLTMGSHEMETGKVLTVLLGIMTGASFLWITDLYLSPERMEGPVWKKFGSRTQVLIFIAMTVHSIPEGVAVGTGYASEQLQGTNLGTYIALAIAIHNIPEGLAVAIPMRAAGASLNRCFWAAVLTSLPQPIAAIPAAMASWFFAPLMPLLMGFAAGAMIFLILLQLIPEALETEKPAKIAWSFMVGFCLMILVQVML